MSLLGGDGAFQDLIGQNASSMVIDVDDLTVNDSVKLDYAEPNKNLITDSAKNVITIDQDSFSNTDGNVVITQTDRNFDINLNTFSANKNIVSGASGELTTENKDSFVDVANQTTWTESAGRVFQVNLPQDIATNSDVDFKSIELTDFVKVNEIKSSNENTSLLFDDFGTDKFLYTTVSSGYSNLGKSSNPFRRVYTERLNDYIQVSSNYISPFFNNYGSLGGASNIWNNAHINNLNTNNITAITGNINLNSDVSATNITATNITATDITTDDLKVNNSFNTLDDFKIYQTGSNPTTTQTKFGLGSNGIISTTTNTDDTFTSLTSANISSAIGLTNLVLSSNPLTSFTATNEFEITAWNRELALGFVKNTYVPGNAVFFTNPRVILTIGGGNDNLRYVNSVGTPNSTSLATSSTIGTTGYKYTFNIDNNKNLTIDKLTPAIPGTTSYVSFTTGSFTTTAGTRGRYVDVQNPSSNTYRIRTWTGFSYNNVGGRVGYRSDTSFKFEDYGEVKATFTIHEINQMILYVGFIQKDADLSNTNTSINQTPYPYKTDYYDFNANNSQPDKFVGHVPSFGLTTVNVNVNITWPTGANLNDIIVLTVNNSGNLNVDWYDNSTSTWNYSVQVSTITLSTTQEYNLYVWDNNTTSSKFDVSAICELTTATIPATTTTIFNSATTPTIPFTLDDDSYKLVVSDETSFASQYEVVVDGSIYNPGSLVTKVELDYLTPDKNLVLDANNVIQVEDKDTITGTTNQINVAQVGRAFTLSAPQDIATTSDVQFNTIQALTYTGDVKTFAIESTATPSSYINLTSTNINLGIGSVGNRVFTIDSNGLTPYVDNTYDLGSNSNNFRRLYANRVKVSAGTETDPAIYSATEGIFFNASPKRINFAINNTESIRITNDAIRSVLDNTYDLGSNGIDFKTLYIKNIENQTKLVLNQLNAYDVVYLDANKEVKGINLPSDHLLVGNGNAPPTTQLIGSTYELHQNQVGTKFDPVKTSNTISIRANGLGIYMNSNGVHRAMCINGITVSSTTPNTEYTGVDTRFGFEILAYANNPNLCIGFGPDTLALDTTVSTGETGNYSLNIQNGKVHENGIDQGNIAGFSYSIGDVFEFVIKTDNKYDIYQNGYPIYASSNTIVNGVYYPQVFDANSNTTEFRVFLRPAVRSISTDFLLHRNLYLFNYHRTTLYTQTFSSSATWTSFGFTSSTAVFGKGFSKFGNQATYTQSQFMYFEISYNISGRPINNISPREYRTSIFINGVESVGSTMIKQVKTDTGSSLTYTGNLIAVLDKNDTVEVKIINNTDTTSFYVDSFSFLAKSLNASFI